jgi:hypothetical protein
LAVHICRMNAERNRVAGIGLRLADWSEWADGTRYDWIVGSDILYADHHHADLRTIFEGNLAPAGRVLLSDPYRPPSIAFLEGLEGAGWQSSHSRWRIGEGAEARAVAVFQLIPPCGSDRNPK